MNEFLQQLANACIPILCLLISAGGAYLVALLKKRTAQIEKEIDNTTATKYINMAIDAVAQAVTYTTQTYVDTLKAEGAFTKEKQLEAFKKSKDKALAILGDTAVAALGEIYGDFDTWLDTKIEQVCRDTKSIIIETEKQPSGETEPAAADASAASPMSSTFLKDSYE